MATTRIPSVEGGIQPTLLTTKGDLISATAASTVARLGVGSDAQILVADSTASTGLAYKGIGVANGLTTTGDTIYSSSGTTQSRLGIGSTGQVLTVAAGVPSWATPAVSASGLTLVTSGTFSAASTVTISSAFNSTYRNYRVMIELTGGSTGYSLNFAFRSAGSTITTNYYSQSLKSNDAGTGVNANRSPTNAAWRGSFSDSVNTTQATSVIVYDIFAPQAAEKASAIAQATAVYTTDYYQENYSYWQNSTTQMDGIYLSNTGGATMTGVYKIYGYAN